jgi:hypothetical protein
MIGPVYPPQSKSEIFQNEKCHFWGFLGFLGGRGGRGGSGGPGGQNLAKKGGVLGGLKISKSRKSLRMWIRVVVRDDVIGSLKFMRINDKICGSKFERKLRLDKNLSENWKICKFGSKFERKLAKVLSVWIKI